MSYSALHRDQTPFSRSFPFLPPGMGPQDIAAPLSLLQLYQQRLAFFQPSSAPPVMPPSVDGVPPPFIAGPQMPPFAPPIMPPAGQRGIPPVMPPPAPSVPPAGQGYNRDAIAAAMRGALAGRADAVIATALRHGLNPAFFAAVIMKESNGGTSRAATDGRFNFTGISGSGRPMKLGSSAEEGLEKGAKLLAQYLRRHGSTVSAIPAIARIYAPVGASNDPNGTNGSWPGGVLQFFRRFGGQHSLAAQAGPQHTAAADTSAPPAAPSFDPSAAQGPYDTPPPAQPVQNPRQPRPQQARPQAGLQGLAGPFLSGLVRGGGGNPLATNPLGMVMGRGRRSGQGFGMFG